MVTLLEATDLDTASINDISFSIEENPFMRVQNQAGSPTASLLAKMDLLDVLDQTLTYEITVSHDFPEIGQA